MNRVYGFSLTEVSITMTVLALLTAGVLQGVSLVDSAKLRSIIAQVSDNKIAINSFYIKHGEYPGDYDLAEAHWGASNTDNGDDDGKIEFKVGSVYEGYMAWQHLAYAGMVTTPYLGTETTGAAELAKDVPESSIKGAGFFLEYGVYGLTQNNNLVLGKPVASTTTILVGGALTPLQAHEIDNKMDDGIPGKGSVRGRDGNGATAQNCRNDGPDATLNNSDDYFSLDKTGFDCIMTFKMQEQ